ncbi:MAG: transposase [Lachnospiraceae bacterium]|nr:transposase [Lachnospiraceae bacterium]
MEDKKRPEVPIHLKFALTLEEEAAYFGIGINRLREISNEKNCGFVLFVGTKRLIKRSKLETYLENISTL